MTSTGDLGKPLPGIGIDLVDLDSFTEACSREGFLEKVFTEAERSYCESSRDPIPSYAVRFAAKEAFYKALANPGLKSVPWSRIETVMEDNVLSLKLSEDLQKRLAGRRVFLSLTHSNRVAAAVVLIIPGE